VGNGGAAMQRAAALAGIAIDNGGTAIAHNIGHAMGSLRPVHHGRAVGVAMLASLPWNVQGDDGRYAACAAAMGAKASATGFVDAYEKLIRACGLGVSVAAEFKGVSAEALAAQMARPENAAMRSSNWRETSEADLLALATATLAAH
jgi:alcohol dehydrogenase